MSKIICLVTILMFVFNLNGQDRGDIDIIVDDFIKELNHRGINEIGYTKHYCVGYYWAWDNEEDRCDYDIIYYEVYLFWRNEGRNYVKKFDNCGQFNHIELETSIFFDFYNSYKDVIKKEEVKPYQVLKIVDKDTTIHSIWIDHSCHRELKLYDGDDLIIKNIDEFDLSENDFGTDIDANINFEFNSTLILVKWSNNIDKVIRKLEIDNKFKRLARSGP
ncbi:MAG: hypothetical protein GXO90_04220 [FCB group bacterium]|nr:hypothetical protein [FCB group bacterium]